VRLFCRFADGPVYAILFPPEWISLMEQSPAIQAGGCCLCPEAGLGKNFP
jgi:hypothetical protein